MYCILHSYFCSVFLATKVNGHQMKIQWIKLGKCGLYMHLYICIVHIQTKERSQNCSNYCTTDFLESDTLVNTPEWAEEGTEGPSWVISESGADTADRHAPHSVRVIRKIFLCCSFTGRKHSLSSLCLTIMCHLAINCCSYCVIYEGWRALWPQDRASRSIHILPLSLHSSSETLKDSLWLVGFMGFGTITN